MARQSLSLSAYLALCKGGALAEVSDWPTPKDPVIWLHLSDAQDQRAAESLIQRIARLRDDLHILLTGRVDAPIQQTLGIPVTAIETPAEALTTIQSVLAHWRPVICLWSGPHLRPALMHSASQSGCRVILYNIGSDPFTVPRLNWMGDVAASVLQQASDIFYTSETAMRRLAKMPLKETTLHESPRLSETPLPLPASETERDALAMSLVGRPVWLAAEVTSEELSTVLLAHRRTGRYTHRLLLALSTTQGVPAEQIWRTLEELGLRAVDWADGPDPEENTQVVVLSTAEDLGLWYRLAPVVFLGRSLSSGHGGADPLPAAALGAAVLYGPNVGNHLSQYSRMVEAGAARMVKDMDSLASALTTVLAPDTSAAMAHAGWELVTASAELADSLIELVLDTLDQVEAPL